MQESDRLESEIKQRQELLERIEAEATTAAKVKKKKSELLSLDLHLGT